MRRIDKMSNEDVLSFFVDTRDCRNCPLVKTNCKEGCEICKEKHLLSEVKTKKRFQTYESMDDAYHDFIKMCYFEKCRFENQEDKDHFFVSWLYEEIVVKNDDT